MLIVTTFQHWLLIKKVVEYLLKHLALYQSDNCWSPEKEDFYIKFKMNSLLMHTEGLLRYLNKNY